MIQQLEAPAICLVAPSLQLGGLENSVAVVANLLLHRGHRVTLATCYRHEHFYKLDGSIKILEPNFDRASMTGLLFYTRWMWFLRTCIRAHSPDAVLAYGDSHNALVLAALKGTRIPVVISDRASPGLQFPWALRMLRNATYPGASGILAQTRRAAQVKQDMTRGRVPIEVIPNAIREFPSQPEVARAPVVLAVARHYHVKGIDRLIEAFAQSELPGWTLEIAGSEGPQTPDLRALVDRLGLSGRVRFLGPVRNLSAAYARAGIFVLPSRSEGFPNALIEAMAHGCPAISFDIDAGPAEIIRNGENGLLIPDGNVPALSSAIRQLAANEHQRQSLGIRAREISEELNPNHIGDRLSAFLHQVAGVPYSQQSGLATIERT